MPVSAACDYDNDNSEEVVMYRSGELSTKNSSTHNCRNMYVSDYHSTFHVLFSHFSFNSGSKCENNMRKFLAGNIYLAMISAVRCEHVDRCE